MVMLFALSARRGPCDTVIWAAAHSLEETEREMKASITLLGLLGLAVTAQVADPAGVMAAPREAARVTEPAWMVLSGASLLVVASLLRRHVP